MRGLEMRGVGLHVHGLHAFDRDERVDLGGRGLRMRRATNQSLPNSG